MKRLFVLVFALLISAFSCSDRNDDVKLINIRVKNVSSLVFEEVQVGEAEELHMNVAPDEYSEYLEYEEAYRYAFIRIQSGEQTFTLQPIDFVGEEVLPPGFYTYELDVSDTGDVSLEFEID